MQSNDTVIKKIQVHTRMLQYRVFFGGANILVKTDRVLYICTCDNVIFIWYLEFRCIQQGHASLTRRRIS